MKRTYTIIHTNCDCSSDLIAVRSMRWRMGPRCPGCRKILGPMQWTVYMKTQADSEHEAFDNYTRHKNIRFGIVGDLKRIRERTEKAGCCLRVVWRDEHRMMHSVLLGDTDDIRIEEKS